MRNRKLLRVFSTAMLFVVAWQSILLACFEFERWLAHEATEHSISELLPEESLVPFDLDTRAYEALDWKERDREFRYDGNMYDVVRKEFLSNGRIRLHCLEDERETRLVEDIEFALAALEGDGREQEQSGRILLHLVKYHCAYHLHAPMSADPVLAMSFGDDAPLAWAERSLFDPPPRA